MTPISRFPLVRHAGLSYFPLAFIARLPFAMMIVGVLTLVVAERGSVGLGGLNSAAAGLGTALAGPLLGAAVDRFGQRRTLVPVGLVHAGLLGVFPLVVAGSIGNAGLLGLSVLIGASAPQIAPMSRTRLVAIIGRSVPAGRREGTLNGTMAYESAADETVFIAGPFLVGLLATAVAPWLAVAGAAALTLVFVTWFALHPTGRIDLGSSTGAPRAQAPARELLRAPLLTVVAGALGIGLFFGGTLTSLTAFLADGGAGDRAGLLYGVMGVGSAVLALGSAAFPTRFLVRWRWLVFGVLLLGSAVAFAAARDDAAVVIALAVAGCGIGPTLVAQYSLVAQFSPVGRSATAMTMLGSAVVVGQALASAATGAVADRLGATAAMLAPAVAAALVVAAAVAHLAAIRSPAAPAEPALVVPEPEPAR